MRRITAGIAITLLAFLAMGGPAAAWGPGPGTLRCATAAPPSECALLDELAAQLGPIAPLLGEPLAPLTASAQGLAARSDQPAGVPTTEVVQVSGALLDQLGALPEPVATIVGAAGLGDLIDTLQPLADGVTAPVTGEQESAGTTEATPARPGGTAGPVASHRSSSPGSVGGSSSSAGASAPSGSTVPDVPVGDPLKLGPLGLPDFGFSQAFEPVTVTKAASAQQVAQAEAVEQLAGGNGSPEVIVVGVLSLLLLAAAGIAQHQATRHTIP